MGFPTFLIQLFSNGVANKLSFSVTGNGSMSMNTHNSVKYDVPRAARAWLRPV